MNVLEFNGRDKIGEGGNANVYRYKDICLNDQRRYTDRVNSNLKFICGWINRVKNIQGV